MQHLFLTCRACGHREQCGYPRMISRVQQLGMLRRAGNPEPALVEELFYGSLGRMKCASCGHTGLAASDEADADWDDDRTCEVCGKLIPRGRLDALPDAKRCVECERAGQE